MNCDLLNICQWSERHELSLNPYKTQAIIISNTKTETSNLDHIIVNNSIVPYSETVKNLGMYFDQTLSWSYNISKMSQRIFSSLRVFWVLTSFGNTQFRLQMFKSFLLPFFLYGDLVMYELKEKEKSRIIRMFNACTRYVFRLKKFDHISHLSSIMLNMSLITYQNIRLCLFIFNLIKSGQPSYLFDRLNFSQSTRTHNINIPQSQVNIYNKSLFVKGFAFWNSLPPDIKSADSRSRFLKEIKEHFC